MFDQAMTLLLSGEFICEVRYPEAFRYLAGDANQKDCIAYLTRIGRTLSRTELGGAWYVSYAAIGDEERRFIKAEFTKMWQRTRFLVEFFGKAMRASNKEEYYSRGDKIEFHALMAAVDGNPGLRAEFQSLSRLTGGSTGDGKLRSLLALCFKELVSDGYLVVANAEREIYQVTGKVEYLTEVAQYLMTTSNISDDTVDHEDPTGSLF
ncbi:hypothetical protein [Chitiniphilus eburneus]|uniref:DUF4194 domain-containing protein n=1 Tax=Chitiniphilus eburneus TaxID=2571148 RepID=A0A4U0PZV0_9NEIS|nr:hypothetical protein [Chitiniphilus eburneus]TJZ74223.1 hypothetical protein FAZ21_08015 [Chitiniphilus eburneus]